jgi:hypothetical protein
MKRGELRSTFLGVMTVICIAALGLGILRHREHSARLGLLRDHNKKLKDSEKLAKTDKGLRDLVAKSKIYGVPLDASDDPVEFIKDAEKKRGLGLDRLTPRTADRRGKGLQETNIEIYEENTEIPPLSELLFYLEEAYPGGMQVKEMYLTRKKTSEPQWDARVTVTTFKTKGS